MQAQIISGLGNPHLDEKMAYAIPAALDRIFSHTHNSMGIFNQARAHASACIKNLKNSSSGKANGFANEILSAARLTTVSATSRSGKEFKINTSDRIDFGLKEQSFYGAKGPISVTDGFVNDIFYQPKRETVEADLIVCKPIDGFLMQEIMVDFKYSSTNSKTSITKNQLEGVLVTLQTNPDREFYFITNTEFSGGTLERVKEINNQIDHLNQDERALDPDCCADIPHIELFEHYSWEG